MRLRPLLCSLTLIPALAGGLLAQQQPEPPPRRDTTRLAEITVVAAPAARPAVPGAVSVIEGASLRLWHPLSVNEALRRVAGVHARDEEGFGLRPNIGIRGLNPSRSTKVLLLEDGIPLTFAPYGDNASYYHPPVSRFERIEVLRGSGQILFGPQTIGGVINYVTPPVPAHLGGTFTLAGGSREHRSLQARAGGTLGALGVAANLAHRTGLGVRANTGTRLDDAALKTTLALGAHTLTVRGSVLRERSNVTYSGLTEAEWALDPRANPFAADSMLLDRWGASLTDRLELGRGAVLLTTLYGSHMSRAWWRQASNSSQRPSDAADPACGGMQNLATTCGNQGRVRDYILGGVEPRLRAPWTVAGVPTLFEGGVRLHAERQDRLQLNGDRPGARTAGDPANPGSGIAEDNRRTTKALALFAQDRLFLGSWTLSPGLRVEHVRHTRTNRLADPDISGRMAGTWLIPGLGATWTAGPRLTLFAGVHRGFAPPRAEDAIDNASGAVVELDAELSWNSELGVRARPHPALTVEATAFRMDFENQVVPASVAGGAGATLTSAGRTLHQGLELELRLDVLALAGRADRLHLDAAWTWVPTARYLGTREVWVGTAGAEAGRIFTAQNGAGTRTRTSVSGHRLPYAPKGLLNLAARAEPVSGVDVRLEMVRTGRQFADALNSAARVPDGQQGVLPAYTLWNAAVNWRIASGGTAVFLSVHNLFDRLYVADRTRGLLPGTPRTMQAGLTQAF